MSSFAALANNVVISSSVLTDEISETTAIILTLITLISVGPFSYLYYFNLVSTIWLTSKSIFACLFSVNNKVSLSRHEQVCLMRLHFERFLSHLDGESISRNVASLNIHVHYVMNLLHYLPYLMFFRIKSFWYFIAINLTSQGPTFIWIHFKSCWYMVKLFFKTVWYVPCDNLFLKISPIKHSLFSLKQYRRSLL